MSKPSKIKKLPEDINFYYHGVVVEYDENKGTITNAKVTEINLSRVFKEVESQYVVYTGFVNEIERYCIDRIIRSLEMYDISKYSIRISSGYYGDEVRSVSFNHISELISRLEILSKSNSDRAKMEYVLTLEYGYVLDALKYCDWAIKEIPRSSVIQYQASYIKKVPFCEFYKNWTLPVCVVIPNSEDEQDGYRIIDGYHRFTNNRDLEKIQVICATPNEDEDEDSD